MDFDHTTSFACIGCSFVTAAHGTVCRWADGYCRASSWVRVSQAGLGFLFCPAAAGKIVEAEGRQVLWGSLDSPLWCSRAAVKLTAQSCPPQQWSEHTGDSNLLSSMGCQPPQSTSRSRPQQPGPSRGRDRIIE